MQIKNGTLSVLRIKDENASAIVEVLGFAPAEVVPGHFLVLTAGENGPAGIVLPPKEFFRECSVRRDSLAAYGEGRGFYAALKVVHGL